MAGFDRPLTPEQISVRVVSEREQQFLHRLAALLMAQRLKARGRKESFSNKRRIHSEH